MTVLVSNRIRPSRRRTESSATTTLSTASSTVIVVGPPGGTTTVSVPPLAHAVGEADRPMPLGHMRTACAVVDDLDAEPARPRATATLHCAARLFWRHSSAPRRPRSRRCSLPPRRAARRRAELGVDGQLDWHGAPNGERGQRAGRPRSASTGSDAAGERPQLVQGLLGLADRLVERRSQRVLVAVHVGALVQIDREADESLLRAIVYVPSSRRSAVASAETGPPSVPSAW